MSDLDGRVVRFDRPQRSQSEWREFSLEQFIPADHRVRVVWRYVQTLDMSLLEAKYKAVEGNKGRNAVDPRILMALWIYATAESISSAREIDRQCKLDLAFMWICGGVSVNYHMIADFRSQNLEFLQKTLVTTVASLIHAEVITLETVAQDGMRVRANAGSSSFRRKASLEQCVEKAKAHIKRLEEQQQQGETTKAQQSAQERAAQENLARAEESLRQVNELEQERENRKKGSGEQARCSTTDPDARTMKMGDGGFRPGYNLQMASDGRSKMIVGVGVTNSGNDHEQMVPMLDQIKQNFGQLPKHMLVDTGFSGKAAITKAEAEGIKVFTDFHGIKAMEKRGKDPYACQRSDTTEYFGFRQRMATPEAQEIYKQRSAIAEYPNAELRNRGLTQFRVRGLTRVLASTLLYVLSFNFLRLVSLKMIN
jgi:transposase/ribosomal protein L34